MAAHSSASGRAILAAFALAVHAASADGLSSDEMIAGRRLANAKCLACHKWRDPAAYSDEKWGEWMVKMKNKAKLNEENYAKLTRYFDALRAQSAPQTTTH